jgi:hydrogenase maturation protease
VAEAVLVIGVGNLERGDDAAGVLVARQMAAMDPSAIRVVEHDGDAAHLIDLLGTAETVFLVDTAISATGQGSSPPAGTIQRFEAHRQPLPSGLRTYSTHAMGVAEGIELARALDRLPQRLVVYTIEGINFAFGEQPGQAVVRGVEQVVERIREEIGGVISNLFLVINFQ